MTNDGNHGGATDDEVKSVFFAYSKSGFEILKDIQARSVLESDESYLKMKQLDIASIASTLMG